MKGRVTEVRTPAGNFVLSQKNGQIICEGQGPDGYREFNHLVEIPEGAKVAVFLASQKLSHIDNRYVSRGDQSTNNGSLKFDGFIHT